MASSKKKKNKSKRKRKQTGSPFSNKKIKMADKKNSKNSNPHNSNSKEQSPACSIPQKPQTNQETNQSPLTSNVYSAAHQTLYGTYPGYPFTPFQPPAPHTTPANLMQSNHQQLPAMLSTMPLLTPSPYQYTNPDLNKFMSEVTERLKKLDMLEDILQRVVSMETHCKKIDCEVSNMKEQIKTHTNNIINLDQGLSEMSNKVQDMGEQNYILFEENRQLKEKVIEQQSRSMRENLIFKGVPDDYNPDEDTEAILKDFIKSEIQIEEEINFHVVHRLKPKKDKSPRGIVAKFERRKDRNMVLSAAIQKLKNKKQFVVHEQYPIEIIERRRELVPILKDARTKGHEAVLKEDRLYIDKKRFFPRTSSQHPPPPVAMDHGNGE
ncbi:histone-lysine N-methyltransferase SETD2-like isoform X1 [Mytilus californianus]|uniref:histone-lysine N-methyltransferase SETD2-like isoform X1 n=1 Tax=Mytilus californianus TaxID=6549 RepID=UPI0022478B77|nr:histone-lysine N-methyltransferase SETD2-like isoform X1 [Mytilus californianus]